MRYLGSINPDSARVHEFTISSTSGFDWTGVQNADCTDLRAYQNGVMIPSWVKPGASLSGKTATVLVRATSTAPILFASAGAGASAYAGTTRVPSVSVLSSLLTLSALHPTFGGGTTAITEFVHPSVIEFASPWAGKTAIMGATYYPSANSAYEDPMLFVCTDGTNTNWTPANVNGTGFPNFATKPTSGFNSDTELVLDATDGTVWLYWREVGPGGAHGQETIWRCQITSDGSGSGVNVTASTPVEVFVYDDPAYGQNCAVCPSIIQMSPTLWYMYVGRVDGAAGNTTSRIHWYRYSSADRGATWGSMYAVPDCVPQDWTGVWHYSKPVLDASTGLIITVGCVARVTASAIGSGGTEWYLFYSADGGNTFIMDMYPMGGSRSHSWTTSGNAAYRPHLHKRASGKWAMFFGAVAPIKIGYVEVTWDLSSRTMNGLRSVAGSGSDFSDGAAAALNWRQINGTVAYAAGSVTLTKYGGSMAWIARGEYDAAGYTVSEIKFRLKTTNTKFKFGAACWNWTAYANGAGNIGIGLTSGAGVVASAVMATDTNWHILRVIQSTATVTLYMDGTQVVTGSLTGNSPREFNIDGSADGDGMDVAYVWEARVDMPTPAAISWPIGYAAADPSQVLPPAGTLNPDSVVISTGAFRRR